LKNTLKKVKFLSDMNLANQILGKCDILIFKDFSPDAIISNK